MDSMKRFFIIAICFFFLGMLTYHVVFLGQIGSFIRADTKSISKQVGNLNNTTVNTEDLYSSDIALKYFDFEANHFNSDNVYLDTPLISKLPVVIDNPDLSESVSKDFEEIYTHIQSSPAKFLDPADVDADGILEKIYYIPVAMNHGAAKFQIIKNNQVIFESKDTANRWFEKTLSGDGFYLFEGLRDEDGAWNIGNRRTRYVHLDGKFVPVWYQDEYKLKGKNTGLSEAQVTQLLIEKFKEYPNTFETWIDRKCLAYWVDDRDSEKYSIEIHEWHKEGCKGDPNTSPLIASFTMDRSTFQVYFNDYIPIYKGGEIPLSEYVELRAK